MLVTPADPITPILKRVGQIPILGLLVALLAGCQDIADRARLDRDTGSAPGRYMRDPTWPNLCPLVTDEKKRLKYQTCRW